MLDFNNEVFTSVATSVRDNHAGVSVTGEFTRKPSKFPAVTLDEISNLAESRLDRVR